MESANSVCGQCNKTIYPADKPVRIPSNVFHAACFKCTWRIEGAAMLVSHFFLF